MRKFVVFVFALFICGASNAATMCVKLDADAECSGGDRTASEWHTNCNGVPVYGISLCSNECYDDEFGSVKSDDPLPSSTPVEVCCWCKVAGPAVSSSWVFAAWMSSHEPCYLFCADACMYGMEEIPEFRRAMLSDLH